LADQFESIHGLRKASLAELEQIDGIGPMIAHSVMQFFEEEHNQEVLEKLEKAGVRMEEVRAGRQRGIFTEKVFVLTGSLSRFTREGATKLIESEGGRVSSSVSSKTDFVLVGENPGSKYRKALDLKVEIIDEDTFIALMQRAKKTRFPRSNQLGMELQ
jgi:DNA ligase (NAD+)